MNRLSKLALAALVASPLAAGGTASASDVPAPRTEQQIIWCPLCFVWPHEIAYSMTYGAIHVRNADNGTERTLAVSGGQPALSPDHTKVAFVDTDGNVHVASASDGSGDVKLTSGDKFFFPSWSPDGHTLVFTSQGLAGSTFAADVYTIPAAGGSMRQLTANGDDPWPVWLGQASFLNASTIVFSISRNTPSVSFAFVSTSAYKQPSLSYLNVEGSDVLAAISASSDGKLAAFLKQNGSCGKAALAIGSLQGTNVTNVHEILCNPNGDVEQVSFGDAGLVAFSWGDDWRSQSLWTMKSVGSVAVDQHVVGTPYLDFSLR
jgi:hypothetical protein